MVSGFRVKTSSPAKKLNRIIPAVPCAPAVPNLLERITLAKEVTKACFHSSYLMVKDTEVSRRMERFACIQRPDNKIDVVVLHLHPRQITLPVVVGANGLSKQHHLFILVDAFNYLLTVLVINRLAAKKEQNKQYQNAGKE